MTSTTATATTTFPTATSPSITSHFLSSSKLLTEGDQRLVSEKMYHSVVYPSKKKKCLVLDLDETLITSRPQPTTLEKTKVIVISSSKRFSERNNKFQSRKDGAVEKDVVKRPGLDKFLGLMQNYYDLYIYTSSRKEYALAILEQLELLQYFVEVFHRRHCQSTETGYIKDLNHIFPFPPSQIVFIDDSADQTRKNKHQSICIKAFNGCPDDCELEKLTPFLIEVSKLPEIRPLQKKYNRFIREYISERLLQQREPKQILTLCEIDQEDESKADELAIPKLDTTKFEVFQVLKTTTSTCNSSTMTPKQTQSTLAKTARKFSTAKAAKWLNIQLTEREDCNIEFEDKELNLEKLMGPKVHQVKLYYLSISPTTPLLIEAPSGLFPA